MKRILSLTAPFALAVALVWVTGGQAAAQTTITQTTLSSAMTATSTTAVVASATTVTAGNYLYIDGELLSITSVSGTTATVRRNVGGSLANSAHATNSVVYVGPGAAFDVSDVVVGSACTASAQLYRPHINTRSGRFFDCEQGFWFERFPNDPVNVASFTVRDDFNRGYFVEQDDSTVLSVTDDEDNIVQGSPLGVIEYREEVTKTASSWTVTDNALLIDGDETDDEGVEMLITSRELLGSFIAGTTGGCIAGSFDIVDISGTDQLHIGFRDNAAFPDVAAYASLTVWSAVGINAADGSIVSSQEVSEATDTDDSGVNWADGETRALKVCVSSAGVPTAYYTDAYTYSATVPDYPTWNAITMTETGSTLTAATDLAPFLSFMNATTTPGDVTVNWLEITRLPR